MPYFVKFVPYNENTLSTLLNKTIKFSTVYEFNDFNELGYCGGGYEGNETTFWNIFDKKFDDNEFRCCFLKNVSRSGIYKTEYIDDFKNRLNKNFKKSHNINLDEDYDFIIENMVFCSIGIFCISDLNVFCDDSAQLMFAHYGDNCKGLALIYEIPSKDCKRVDYINRLKISGGESRRPFQWLNGDYSKMDDFLKKSEKWAYEKEYRVFKNPHKNPDIPKAEEHRIRLRAILYAVRFSKDNIDALNAINRYIYEGKLIIQEIRPSSSHYKFVVHEENSEQGHHCILEFIDKKLEKTAIGHTDHNGKLLR